MKQSVLFAAILALATTCLLAACAEKAEPPAEEAAAPAAEEMVAEATMEEPAADPSAEEATEVEEFVRAWLGERADEAGVYAIPARGGHEVSGAVGAFHTVHRQDEDSYAVCVDFHEGENLYDVDFFVDRTADGLAVADHYLHKVNSDPVEEAGTS
jgi:hypothetical protein